MKQNKKFRKVITLLLLFAMVGSTVLSSVYATASVDQVQQKVQENEDKQPSEVKEETQASTDRQAKADRETEVAVPTEGQMEAKPPVNQKAETKAAGVKAALQGADLKGTGHSIKEFNPTVSMGHEVNGKFVLYKNGEILNLDDIVTLQYSFNLTAEQTGAIDYTAEYELPLPPEYVKIGEDKDILVTLNDNTTPFGTIFLRKDSGSGTAVFKFHPGIRGDKVDGAALFFGGSLDKDKIGDAKEIVIDLDGTHSLTVKIKDNEPKDPKIEKTGEFDKATGLVTWKVTLTPGKPALTAPQLIDKLGDGQVYETDSFRMKKEGESDYQQETPTWAPDDKTISYDITPDDFKDKLYFQYQTRPAGNLLYDGNTLKNEGTQTLTNNARLYESGEPDSEVSTSDTVSVETKDSWLAKTGAVSPLDKRLITWTLTINNVKQAIDNVILYDTIPKGLTLAGDVSLKDSQGNLVEILTMTGDGGDGNGNITYESDPFNLTDTGTITYTTKVDEGYFENNDEQQFVNKAWITVDWDPGDGTGERNFNLPGIEKGVTVQPSAIAKKAIGSNKGYDAATHRIKWLVTVNGDNTNMGSGDAVIRETVRENQELVLGSIKESDNSGTPLSPQNDIVVSDETKTGATITFSNVGTSTRHFVLETEVTNVDFYADNKTQTYYNDVALNVNSWSETKATGSTEITSEVIKKTGAGYDYDTNEISWKIVVNKNKMEMGNVHVMDTLPEGYALLKDTVEVKKTTVGSWSFNSSDLQYNEATRELNIHLSDETATDKINDQYTITFKVKITDTDKVFDVKDNGTVVYLSNTAELKTTAYNDAKSEGKQSVSNQAISKASAYKSGDPFIDYTVNINKNKQTLKNGFVTDTLPKGLQLDLTTVKLFEANVDDKGTFSEGQEVTRGATQSNYKRTYTVREDGSAELRIDLPTDPSKYKQPYLLKYGVDVSGGNGRYTNQAKLNGIGDGAGANKGVQVSISGGGGGGTNSRNRYVELTKLDSKTNKVLAGVEFGLYLVDDGQDIEVSRAKTNASGKLTFYGLAYGAQYKIKELKPLAGYEPNEKVEVIDAAAAGTPKLITLKITNDPANVNFVKKDGDGNPLKGAKFTLFKADGTTELATVTSDDQGKVKFGNISLTDSEYTLKEAEAPTGFVLDKQTYKVKKDAEGLYKIYDPKNTEIKSITNYPFSKVTIIKMDADDPSQLLPGAVFEMKAEDGTVYTKATGAAGKAEFNNLPFGEYTLTETKAPDGYILSSYATKVYVKDDESSRNIEIKRTNQKAGLSFIKKGEVSEINTGVTEGIGGARFGLYRADNPSALLKSAISSTSGSVVFSNIAVGRYIIRELEAPQYYNLNKTEFYANINSDGTFDGLTDVNGNRVVGNEVVDTARRASIKLTKVNESKPGQLLEGSTYGLYKMVPKGSSKAGVKSEETEAVHIISKTTDENGLIEFDNLLLGRPYMIKEEIAPDGFQVSKDPIYFTMMPSADNPDVIVKVDPEGKEEDPEVTWREPPTKVHVTKTDMSGKPLSGARLTITDMDGNPVEGISEWTSSEEAHLIEGILVAGKQYKLVEIKAPVGYAPADPKVFTVTEDKVGADADFIDKITLKNDTTKVAISKIDGDSKKALSGAKLQLKDKEDKVVASWTSTEEPRNFTGKLEAGRTYTLEELKAPAGYKKAKPLSFEVKKDGVKQTILLKNTRIKTSDVDNGGSGNNGNNPNGDKPGGNSNGNGVNGNGGNAKTGDTNDWMIYAFLMIVSLTCCIIILRKSKKHQK